MNKETKDKVKDVAREAAGEAAEWLKEEAKSSTGLMRWVWGVLALLAMGVCAWLTTGCTVSWSIGADGSQIYEHNIVVPQYLLK
jgi:hypothetical protein